MPPGMLSMGGPLVQARNFMVMTGVNAGVLAVAKRLRGGRDDVNNQIISGWWMTDTREGEGEGEQPGFFTLFCADTFLCQRLS